MIETPKGAVPGIKVTAEVSPGTWRHFRFDRHFRIGRLKGCDLFIDNSYVSRAHAEVVVEDGRWSIRDLGSVNGIFFGGERVPSVALNEATTVKFGEEGPEVRFEVEKTVRRKLLSKHRDKIPRETYDYVFNIASAAVIGENPRLFGFDFDNPLAAPATQAAEPHRTLSSGPG